MKRCNPDVVAALNRRVSVGPARGPSVTAWGPSGLQRPAQSATTRRAGSLRKAPRGGLLRQAPHAIPPRTRRYPLASGSFLTTHCGPISTAPVISALGSRFWRFAKWKHSATQHRPNKTIRLHDGTAEPCRVTPPEAVVYYVNYPRASRAGACVMSTVDSCSLVARFSRGLHPTP